MTKKFFILVLIFGFSAISGFAQKSSQAVMRVSVRIVSGASISFDQSKTSVSSVSKAFELGEISLEDEKPKNVFVNLAPAVDLVNENGSKAMISIEGNTFNKSGRIKVMGSCRQDLNDGLYKGNLVATFEYF